jgi:pilus assembly protein CpaD
MRAPERQRIAGKERAERFRLVLKSCAILAFALPLAAALTGCGARYASSDPVFPGDFEARHPIALVSAPATIDVFPAHGRLDGRTLANLRAFVERYRAFGSGEIVILTPAAERPDAAAVGAVRQALAGAGAAKVGLSTYPAGPGGRAAPIRVAFMGLEAKVATPCGNWPEDLASGSSLEGWQNEPYANFGCAYQTVLAAQVDDPRDLIQPQALGPSDPLMRMRAIDAVRKGQDPGTKWTTDLVPIGGSGSGGGSSPSGSN